MQRVIICNFSELFLGIALYFPPYLYLLKNRYQAENEGQQDAHQVFDEMSSN